MRRSNAITLLKRISLPLVAALGSLLLAGSIAPAGERIAVFLSSQEAPFLGALEGVRGYLQKQGADVVYDVHRLEDDAVAADEAVRKAREGGATLVLTIGSQATSSAIKRIDDLPIIACLVMRMGPFRKATNVTGVGLEFPLEVQLSRLQDILPEAHTIGVLYNPGENRHWVEEAGRIAKSKGFRLLPIAINAPQDVPAALTAMAKKADVLLGVPDSIAFSPQMAKPLLLFSFRNSIPLVGLSSAWVKAGAIYALDWDYEDLGEQAGEIAWKVLKGARPADISPATPRKTLYSVNVKTAGQMKIDLPAGVVRDARTAF